MMDGSSFFLSNPNVQLVLLGTALLSSSAAVVGTFTFLKKKALIGDAVAHALLPGVCLGFLLAGEKNPWIIIPASFITGFISLQLVDFIARHSKIKSDTAIALVLSVFFGVGIVLLTFIQHQGSGKQSGLDQFLFGQAAAMEEQDIIIFSILAIAILISILLFYKELKAYTFDPEYAKILGMPLRSIEFLLNALTVLAIVCGIQAVGVVLMAALLITPAAAARYWTHRLGLMILIAVSFGIISGFTGAMVSWFAPTMPTGPWIVMTLSAIAMASFFLAPGRGIIFRMRRQHSNQKRMLEENILKSFFHLGERDGELLKGRAFSELMSRRSFTEQQLKKGLIRLEKQGYLKKTAGHLWAFTSAGKEKGQRVVKIHRLWELYLTHYLRIAPDHVHDDAETIEHIITPELEAKLEASLDYPLLDPHASEIPYKSRKGKDKV